MDLNKYINMPNAVIPTEIYEKLKRKGGITITDFDNKNDILTNDDAKYDSGYDKIGDHYLVSMYTPMPAVTKEMVEWWFWWHAQESERYKAWYPGKHFSISYAKKNAEYFSKQVPPDFQPNRQEPVERVGKLKAPLTIDFVSPEDFGFDKEIMVKNGVEIIVCGHVSAFKGKIPNTEMAHIFFANGDGLLLVSRFWLGKNLKCKLLKKLLLTEKQAKGMAEHCCIEYRNFATKIPLMYSEWKKETETT